MNGSMMSTISQLSPSQYRLVLDAQRSFVFGVQIELNPSPEAKSSSQGRPIAIALFQNPLHWESGVPMTRGERKEVEQALRERFGLLGLELHLFHYHRGNNAAPGEPLVRGALEC